MDENKQYGNENGRPVRRIKDRKPQDAGSEPARRIKDRKAGQRKAGGQKQGAAEDRPVRRIKDRKPQDESRKISGGVQSEHTEGTAGSRKIRDHVRVEKGAEPPRKIRDRKPKQAADEDLDMQDIWEKDIPEDENVSGKRKSSSNGKSSGDRKGKKKSGKASTIILIIAIIVFCVSAFQLGRILYGYYQGRKEYNKIRDIAINTDGDTGDPFTVDFDKLLEINPDTVGWIRFDPEPSQINYPVVQGKDNDYYLYQTFSGEDNLGGTIFVNAGNAGDFNDRNTIVYGHRMNDSSMFHDLAKYEEKTFWEDNPYFYIYTPDGREITYHIYAAGVVTETSDTYSTEFGTKEAYQEFLDYTKEASAYDTGVEVDTDDVVVTLSTCTQASDENRMVVVGVKTEEKQVGQ